MSTGSRDRAVVLGASMAGLLAARVLADLYAEVVVVDRDDLRADQRRGVPQARHIHALLARGQQVLEELFPGLTAQLTAAGVPSGDMLGDARLSFSGQRLRQAPTGLVVLSASRACLENRVRARVQALPTVTFGEPSDVVGFVSAPDRRRIEGVRLLRRTDGSTPETLRADLVVDAMGRGSRTPVWLEGLGYQRPDEEQVRAGVGYATRRYRLPADALGRDLVCLQGPTPAFPRGGALARIEGGVWMLTLMGLLGDHPPTDPDGFLEFARSLPFPDIADAIGRGNALDDPVGFRFPASVRRRYDRLARFPDRLVVVGDSACSFNPIYGQGMTVAALEAVALGRHLLRYREPRSRRFHREVARIVDAPWDMAAGGDLAFPATEGQRTRKRRIAAAYVTRLHAAAAHDAELAAAFLRVSGLVDRPEAILRPAIALRVLRHRLRRAQPAPAAGRERLDAPADVVHGSDAAPDR